MSISEDKDNANELSAEDLDLAVGGASIEAAGVTKGEENVKLTSKGEQRRKHDLTPREEKAKRE